MSETDFYNGGGNTSSIAGGYDGVVSDAAGKAANSGINPQLVREAKRQIHLRHKGHKSHLLDDASFLALVAGMGYKTLERPFMQVQITDLRNRDVDKRGISAVVVNTFFDMAATLFARKDPAIGDIYRRLGGTAANSPGAPTLEIDDAA